METNKITMKDRILKYMQDFGSITTREAFVDLGCSRLSEYIRQLREEYCVADRWGDKTEYKRYWIEYKYDSEGV